MKNIEEKRFIYQEESKWILKSETHDEILEYCSYLIDEEILIKVSFKKIIWGRKHNNDEYHAYIGPEDFVLSIPQEYFSELQMYFRDKIKGQNNITKNGTSRFLKGLIKGKKFSDYFNEGKHPSDDPYHEDKHGNYIFFSIHELKKYIKTEGIIVGRDTRTTLEKNPELAPYTIMN